VAARVVPDSEGAGASLRDVLAAALDANREMARLAAVLREENARLRAENAEQAAELARVRADLAVLQRMVFGRSSERAQPEPSADGGDAGQGRDLRGCRTGGKKPALPVSWTDVALIITNRKFYEFRPGRKEA
jgi:transposase